ncbi:hypothetical protein [Pseudomonas sp.]|uniref:hypothetical protein n=1 Tax=Pseudomonas sp. TaxID=306 RepID=UPI0019F8A488|nr:hypothetical protein [Pseudomonas sp.]MBF0675548.1 hypothetical protein [Pseudomonas sp.]
MSADLSEAAKAICAKHYNFKSRSSCNPCSLRPECHRPGETLTQASLDEWRGRVNRLAEQQEAQ